MMKETSAMTWHDVVAAMYGLMDELRNLKDSPCLGSLRLKEQSVSLRALWEPDCLRLVDKT